MLWKVVVFNLYLWMRNFLASSSWDWDLIYRSMLWWLYWSSTYTSKGDEIAWMLIGTLAFVVAILSAAMLILASIVSSNLGILESWCPRIYWTENYLEMSCNISYSASFSASLWRPWLWTSFSRSQFNLFTYAWLSHIDRHWFWIDMLWYSEYKCRNNTAAREACISALYECITLLSPKFGLTPEMICVPSIKEIIH